MFFILSQAWDEEKIPLEELLKNSPWITPKKFLMRNSFKILHEELLVGIQNFFFLSRLRQDEEHLSLFLYWAKTSLSFLFEIIVGGESIPDNPLEEVNGVNGTGSLYSRWTILIFIKDYILIIGKAFLFCLSLNLFT